MKHSILLTLLLFTSSIFAQQQEQMPNHKGSKELQKIKALVGTWVGKMDHGKGPMPVEINYKVTAAGSAVVETFHPGTPMEMVTVYHDEKGKLVMTHYCMLGNQPKMKLVDSSENKVFLDLVEKSIFDKDKPYMSAQTIDFLCEDKISHTWGCCDGGDKHRNMSVEFTRKKQLPGTPSSSQARFLVR